MRIACRVLNQQCKAILRAWGMSEGDADIAAERIAHADMHGVDSHGVATLPLYAQLREQNRINFRPDIRVVRETPVTAVIDGDSSLGHVPATRAMELAIDKCKLAGIAAVAVRNSNHFGAAGAYAALAARRALIGMAFTSAWDPIIVPTFGAEPRFGTNPLAFAAPSSAGMFYVDIATSTVSMGKLRVAELRGVPLEPGWALDAAGTVTRDAEIALSAKRLTPLGGTPAMGSHKGYGLAAIVEILSTMLPGAWYCATRPAHHPGETRLNVGHFLLAIDPAAFRDFGSFAAELDDMIAALRATKPAAAEPVIVPGDLEAEAFAERSEKGIDLSATLRERLRAIAIASGAPWLLT